MFIINMLQDSVISKENRYRFDGAGIESRWVRDFPHPFRPAYRPIHPPIQWVTILLPGVKAADAWR